MPKKEVYACTESLEIYLQILSVLKDIDRKGAAMPYTSTNGNMFSFLDKDGYLGLRLPEKDRIKFLEKHSATLCEAHGTVLREYVLVPEHVFKNLKLMTKYMKVSFQYASKLKAK